MLIGIYNRDGLYAGDHQRRRSEQMHSCMGISNWALGTGTGTGQTRPAGTCRLYCCSYTSPMARGGRACHGSNEWYAHLAGRVQPNRSNGLLRAVREVCIAQWNPPLLPCPSSNSAVAVSKLELTVRTYCTNVLYERTARHISHLLCSRAIKPSPLDVNRALSLSLFLHSFPVPITLLSCAPRGSPYFS